MNSLLISLKKSPKYLAYPFIFVSSFLFITDFLNLFSFASFRSVYEYARDNMELLFGMAAVFFICFYVTDSKKAIAAALCFAFSDSVFFSLSNEHFSLVFGVVWGFVISALIKNVDLIYSFVLMLVAGMVIGICIGLAYDYLFLVLKSFCKYISRRELLFSFINNAYSLFFTDNFAELMYDKDYTGSVYINDQLVAGVRGIFSADTEHPLKSVSAFMTGRYFVNIFTCLGVYAALYRKFNHVELAALTATMAIAVAFGDIKLFSLFILMYNPIIYLGFLAVCFISYLSAWLLDIRIGFADMGSIIELIKYGNKWLYFIIAGLVIAVLSYFTVQIAVEKFDIESRKVLPKEVRKIINALGGEKNIEKITQDKLFVKNPNLINVLALDCDIHENEITLHYGDFDLLRSYF